MSEYPITISQQNLNVKSGPIKQQFQNQIKGGRPKLEPFLSPVYQYSWNQPFEHDKDEIASCWLRLDGARHLPGNKQDRFMIMIPNDRHSVGLDPKQFEH